MITVYWTFQINELSNIEGKETSHMIKVYSDLVSNFILDSLENTKTQYIFPQINIGWTELIQEISKKIWANFNFINDEIKFVKPIWQENHQLKVLLNNT